MAGDTLTERDLRLMHGGNPQVQIMLDWSLMRFKGQESYEGFCELVERGVVWSMGRLAANPKDAPQSENGISYQIVQGLLSMAFEVGFDTTVGGHCDIVVNYGTRYLWLGEAKIYGGPKYLLKGYLQLTTRYAVGEDGSDRGALLIYFQDGDLPKVMKGWGDYISLIKSRRNGATISVVPTPSPACSFTSSQDHYRTGRPFKCKHMPVSLIWDPEV